VFPASCSAAFPYATYAVAYCDNSTIKTTFGDFSRSKLAVMAVCFDVTIIIVFAIALQLMKGYFIKEVKEFSGKNILLTDFSV